MVTTAQAMRRITREAFDNVFVPAGFVRTGRRNNWTRQTTELVHVIGILQRRKWHQIQWGVVSPEAIQLMWGQPADPTDVGYSVMSGSPGNIRQPAPGESWNLAVTQDEDLPQLVEAISLDVQLVETRLRAFAHRRDVWTYLMENRDRTDRRDFLIPANLPLKLMTAAVLASIDRDRLVCDLLPEIDGEMLRFKDRISEGRLRRLHEVADLICN